MLHTYGYGVRLDPLKFSPWATVNHHGPGQVYTFRSLYCIYQLLQKNILQRSHNYGVWNYWQQKLYCICNTIWIDWHDFWTRTGRWEFELVHPLHPIDNRSRNRRRNLYVGWCVSPGWPLFPSRSSMLIYIYIYIYIFAFSIWVLWFTSCVLLSDYNSLIPRCLRLLAFVLNSTLILGIWCSTIPHLPGCFCPWTLFQNIGFNMVPWTPLCHI